MNHYRSIQPTDLRDYLKSRGWSLIEAALEDRLYALSSNKYPDRQMIFPMDVTAPDYEDTVANVINKISEIRSTSPELVASRIRSVRDDVLRLRVYFDGDDSSLPLNFASSLVQSTVKMLKASACTVVRPRMRHPKLTLAEAGQFVEHARFGQTDEGSFILNVSCPINAMDAQGALELDDGQSPFVRRVTFSLEQALAKLTKAIEADTLDGLVESLKSTKNPIISSNLCDALFSMHDQIINNSVDINFLWSTLKSVPSEKKRQKIRLQRDYFSRIEEVSRELKAIEVKEVETYIGTVESLDGDMGKSGKRSGNVILSVFLPEDDEIVSVRTVLSVDDYAKADTAHMTEGSYVMVSGRLLPGRQPRQLIETTDFLVLGDSAQ